jgi:hypothetical protein
MVELYPAAKSDDQTLSKQTGMSCLSGTLLMHMRRAAVFLCLAFSPLIAAPSKKSGSHNSISGASHKTRRRKARHLAPSYQLHPDPERYQQIQQALADRGYFKGQANGQWNDDSSDALRRFQLEQKLPQADGKLDALSLTALGLGPKHGLAISNSAPAVPPTAQPAALPPAPAEASPQQP